MDLETNSMIMIKAVMAKPMRHTIDKPFMANSKKNPMIKPFLAKVCNRSQAHQDDPVIQTLSR